MTDINEQAVSAERALADAEVLLSKADLDNALNTMAKAINDRYQGLVPLVLCVMNGGLYTTAALVQKLTVSLTMDYLHATRYNNTTVGTELKWLAAPQSSLQGRHVIVVDDILDEGHTLKAIVSYCKDQGAKSVTTALLVKKIHDRCVCPELADFIGAEVPDDYVFGCGMDYNGFHRNLPEIYRLKQQ